MAYHDRDALAFFLLWIVERVAGRGAQQLSATGLAVCMRTSGARARARNNEAFTVLLLCHNWNVQVSIDVWVQYSLRMQW